VFSERKLRVLLAKMGLDAHDTGMMIVSNYLRDAGMEVIYGGIYNTPEGILNMVEQENVDLIGLSFLTREHLINIKKLRDLLANKGVKIPIVVGGIIPNEDIPKLKEMGIKKVFGPGTARDEIVNSIREILRTN
jgi:methylmalonyl-CoA mutase C-terminal domain/subunit